jgi:hypothetical protein
MEASTIASRVVGTCKAGHVAHHAAAQSHHQGTALQPLGEGRIVNEADAGQGLAIFSRLKHQQVGVEARLAQRGEAALAIGRGHVWIAHNQHLATGAHPGIAQALPKTIEAARFDHHVVGLLLKRHRDAHQS